MVAGQWSIYLFICAVKLELSFSSNAQQWIINEWGQWVKIKTRLQLKLIYQQPHKLNNVCINKLNGRWRMNEKNFDEWNGRIDNDFISEGNELIKMVQSVWNVVTKRMHTRRGYPSKGGSSQTIHEHFNLLFPKPKGATEKNVDILLTPSNKRE